MVLSTNFSELKKNIYQRIKDGFFFFNLLEEKNIYFLIYFKYIDLSYYVVRRKKNILIKKLQFLKVLSWFCQHKNFTKRRIQGPQYLSMNYCT